jgi:hypothetical protein
MAISIREFLIKIALMGMGLILFQMAINIKVNFYKDCNMAEESIHMLDPAIMMENGLMEGKKEKEK